MKSVKKRLAACLLASLSFAGIDAKPDEYFQQTQGIDFHFEVIKLPQFPHTLINEGFIEGHVKISMDIDYAGELRDWLVIESSHPDFVKALERVIDDWRFSPPYINGENRSIVTELALEFKATGSVISMINGLEIHNRRFNELTGFKSHYSQLSKINELDTPPFPIEQTSPSVSQEMIDENTGARAEFTFYVDEAGQVRIPVLSQTDGNPDLSMLLAAQDAISQWKFEPPTKNKRPVKIQLSQTFVFK